MHIYLPRQAGKAFNVSKATTVVRDREAKLGLGCQDLERFQFYARS